MVEGWDTRRDRLVAQIAEGRRLRDNLVRSLQEVMYELEDANYRLGQLDERRQS